MSILISSINYCHVKSISFQTIKSCENTDFTTLNSLILKALFSGPRFIYGRFEGSDEIFHQKISIPKLNQMLNSHFNSTFMLGNWFGNLGLKNG